jgi:DNA-binding NarL/FixJ family response regulator
VRILIAQRSPLLRDLLVGAFAGVPDAQVAEPVAGYADLLDACAAAPGVVLAGMTMPDGDLADVIAPTLLSGARVLVVCEAANAEAALALLFAGAAGFLFVEDAGPADIVAAARTVAAGHAALHPAAAAAVLQLWRAAQIPAQPVPVATVPAQRLTPRETEVLTALGCGLPTKLIGRRLGVSPKTAEAHISRVLAKLAARNRAHAVSIALETGLLAPHDLATVGFGSSTS